MERTIVLDCGYTAAVDDVALDDFELVDYLAELDEIQDDEENTLRAFRLVRLCLEKLIGKEQFEELKNHMRKGGRIPLADFANVLEDVFNKLGEEAKN